MGKSMTELRTERHLPYGIAVTCHLTQVSAPSLNRSHAGRYTRFTYPGGMEG